MSPYHNLKKDFLTNCFVRDSLPFVLQELQERHAAEQKPFSILIADVDNFKRFNDKYGHICGDEVLKHFSSSLYLDLSQPENLHFRFGGDEFVVVLPEKNAREAMALAEKLRVNLKRREFRFKRRVIPVTFSGGIACFPDDTSDVGQLLEKADKALYLSKKRGRARSTIYSNLRGERVRFFVTSLVFLSLVFLASFCLGSLLWKHQKDWMAHNPSSKVPAPSTRENLKESSDAPLLLVATPDVGSIFKNTEEDSKKVVETAEGVIVYLKSGRVIRGKDFREEGKAIRIELNLQSGEGALKVPKSSIAKIEKNGKTYPFEDKN